MAWNLGNGDKVELTLYCRHTEQVAVNVFHYEVSGLVGTVTAQSVVNDLANRFAAGYTTWLANAASFAGAKLRLVGEDGVLPAPVYSVAASPDGASGVSLPRQLCGLLQKRREAQGPKGRGRAYIPFPGEDMRAGPSLSAAGEGALTAIIALLWGTTGAFTIVPVVGQSATFTAVLWNRETNSFSFVIRYNHTSQFATQLRRGSYGRPNVLPSELL